MRLSLRNISLLYILCAGSLAAQSQADSVRYKFDPVLVTGTTAKERETPVTFTNIGKGLLQERYTMQDVPVLLSELPSMISYSDGGNGVGYNYVFLRGFDQRRLSIMVNGVPQNDPEDHNVYWIDFPDLLASASNVQVQRGAGSAFYGPPAIGGSVNITTNPFTPKPYARFEMMAGFQEYADSSRSLPMTMKKFSAAFNSGLIDNTYMFYGRLGKMQSNGYRLHSSFEAGSYFLGMLRFDEEMTTRVHLFGGPLSDQLVYTGLPKFVNKDPKLRRMNFSDFGSDGKSYTYTVPRRDQEVEGFNQPHYEIINEWKLSDRQKLTNTLFFYDSHGYFDFDGTWVGMDYDTGIDTDTLAFRLSPHYVVGRNIGNEIIRAGVDLVQWGWLPRYEMQHESGELTIGGEYRYHHGSHWGKLQYAEGLPANYDPDFRFYQYDAYKHMASVYVSENYHLQEEMTLMANIQFAYNRYEIANEKFIGTAFTVPYYFLNPRVGLNYNVTEEINTYISLSYTSREPRLRNLYSAEDSYAGALPAFSAKIAGGAATYDFTKPIAKPEQLLNLELGAGYKDAQMQFTGNLYWMEFTNELVKSGQVDVFGNPVYGNAPRTRHIGVEVDGQVRPVEDLVISGNLSLSSNYIVTFSSVDFVDTLGVVHSMKLDGNPIAGFPGLTANLRAGYQHDGLSASIVAKFVGPFYTDNFKNVLNRNDAYTVLNLETVVPLPKIGPAEVTLRGEVRNLLDKLYLQSGEGNQFYPAAERNYLLGIAVQL